MAFDLSRKKTLVERLDDDIRLQLDYHNTRLPEEAALEEEDNILLRQSYPFTVQNSSAAPKLIGKEL